MTLRWHPLVAGVCLLTLTGCTSDESGSAAPGGGALNPGGDEGPPDGLGGEREFPGGAGGGAGQTEGEAEDPPVGRPDPVKPSPGQYGAPCDDDDDCTSQVCVPDADAGICSLPCLEDCLPFYPDRNAFCRSDPSRTEAVSFVCYPEQDLSCEPCVDDSQCDGGACLDTPDGKVCGQPCGSDDDCKTGFSCGAHGACKPISGSCTCTPLTDGRTRVCTWSNDFGTCAGEETCNAAVGWVGCTAAEPAAEACDGVDDNCNGVADDGVLAVACARQNEHGACQGTAVCQGPDGVQCLGADAEVEVCDGIDNDCDGAVDEGFVDDRGGYGLLEHCGGCNRTCEGRFSFATTCWASRCACPSPTCRATPATRTPTAPPFRQAPPACSWATPTTLRPCSGCAAGTAPPTGRTAWLAPTASSAGRCCRGAAVRWSSACRRAGPARAATTPTASRCPAR